MNECSDNAGDGPSGLIDLFSGFDYEYRMRCECGAVVVLSPREYWEQSSGSRWCEGCQEDVNFGPYTTLLRNMTDPLLPNSDVGRHAWYHTSKYRDWPAQDAFLAERERFLAEHPMRDTLDFESIAELGASKALHIGTYEAAVENMLRRMRDQTEVGGTFYLHRVELRLRTSDINDGFLDENVDDVSQIPLSGLEARGLLAIRYLNVRESLGSLSLAIDPAAIASIQTIELPIPTLTPAAEPTHVLAMRAYDRAENEVRAAATIAIRDGFRLLLGAHFDALRLPKSRPPNYRPSPDSLAMLEDAFLPGVGQPVRADFSNAIVRWHPAEGEDIEPFYEHFRAFSTLLTRPDSVVAAVRKQPVRAGKDIKIVRARQSMRDSGA